VDETYIRVKGKWVYLHRAVDSTGATIDFLLSAKRDVAAAERFLAKALGGQNHPASRVINTDKHAAYPPAIAELKADGVLDENSKHRPVQYLNNVLGQDHRAIKRRVARKPTFPLVLGSLAYDWLRSDSYDSQRPGVRECGGCEGRTTAPIHSRSVRGDELKCRSLPELRLDYKVATHPCREALLNASHCNFEVLNARRPADQWGKTSEQIPSPRDECRLPTGLRKHVVKVSLPDRTLIGCEPVLKVDDSR
jgi:hypothetical protein